MPREEVHKQYGSVAECREKQLEGYPALVDSYPIESAFAVHVEMFARHGGLKSAQQREALGQKVYAGGFCIHMPDWGQKEAVAKSIDFALADEEELQRIAKKREVTREKKARQREKKKEAKLQAKMREGEEEEAKRISEDLERRSGLIKPSCELADFLKNMQIEKTEDQAGNPKAAGGNPAGLQGFESTSSSDEEP